MACKDQVKKPDKSMIRPRTALIIKYFTYIEQFCEKLSWNSLDNLRGNRFPATSRGKTAQLKMTG